MLQTLGAQEPRFNLSHFGSEGDSPQRVTGVFRDSRQKTTVTKRNDPSIPPPGILSAHWAELEASGVAPDVAACNVASFGPGTERHWETERAGLTRHKRLELEEGGQPGNTFNRRIRLDKRYEHLRHGGWRTLSDALPGLDLPVFDLWKPDQPRTGGNGFGKGGKPIKYEASPGFPDGGGLLLPRVPDRCWEAIARRHGLPFSEAREGGFWAWVLANPSVPVLAVEGWKKALAAVSAGHAAVALSGVQMGRRVDRDNPARHKSERLIPALEALAKDRPLLVVFDAERKATTARKVAAAAAALARCLRKGGGRPEISRLPLLPGTDKTGLDDLWVAGGTEALDRALADTGPRPVLPFLRAADRIAPAGQWLGEACPIPSPEEAPLVILQAPMGCGKTHAIETALRPLQEGGVPILLPSHRQALGQALADRVGIPWEAMPGTDDRLQGVAACLDSWCPTSRLQITGETGRGGVIVLDEWMQQLDHLLMSTGTALADRNAPRRAAVLRTLTEQPRTAQQVIAADGQMAQWGVALLEDITGRPALLIRSEHQPMAGRPLHCRPGLTTPKRVAEAFRGKLAATVEALPVGGSLMVWCSAQKGEKSQNAPENLADRHRRRRPADLVDVIDSTTRELAAELTADPDGFAARRIAEATKRGGAWVLYCSPAISSGVSWDRWKPSAVIAYSGGRIAPEHVAQALARVRSAEVPCWLFTPEKAPGNALRVGNGATNPKALDEWLAGVGLFLGAGGEAAQERALRRAWAELGAIRNRQRFAYRVTIAGLLDREGWKVQETGPDDALEADTIGAELKTIRDDRKETKQQAILKAEPLSPMEASRLERRRSLDPAETAALERYRLAERWGIAPEAPLTRELLTTDEDRPTDRLRFGWILSCSEALATIPAHDWLAVERLDPEHGQPFAPDRLRVSLAPKVVALQNLGVGALMERFGRGETIAATDPAVLALHATATAHCKALAATLGVSPGKKASGTLRTLLRAVGWELKRAGQIHTRGGDRGACTYVAAPLALPEGVSWEALAGKWLKELREGGQKISPMKNPHREESLANHPLRSSPPPARRFRLAPAVVVAWPAGPPKRRSVGFAPV
jgi:hypothetical protein